MPGPLTSVPARRTGVSGRSAHDPLARRPQTGEQVAATAGSLPPGHAGEVAADDQKAWVLRAKDPLAHQ